MKRWSSVFPCDFLEHSTYVLTIDLHEWVCRAAVSVLSQRAFENIVPSFLLVLILPWLVNSGLFPSHFFSSGV